MARLKLEFIKTGLFTSVQDEGRSGYQQRGIPISGALDKQSYHKANVLVGNKVNSSAIEITFLGPEIYFYDKAKIALCGADIPITVNGEDFNTDQVIDIPENSVVSIGKAVNGCRAYLAIAGTWKTKKWLGSSSKAVYYSETLTPDSLITEGSKIEIESRNIDLPPSEKLSGYGNTALKKTFSVYPGPEFEQFSRETIAHFFSKDHMVSPQSNRIACQLEEKIPNAAIKEEMLSSGVIPGTIQLTASGTAIILLADAQTTGGYPRIGQIMKDDLNAIGQLKGGDHINFRFVS